MDSPATELTDRERLRLLGSEFVSLQENVECERESVERRAAETLRWRLRPLMADLKRIIAKAGEADVNPMYRAGVTLVLRQLQDALEAEAAPRR